jgi:endonuclease YncB( thermonuclease family)
LFLPLSPAPPLGLKIVERRVVSVADGDTITLLDSNRQQHRIRLAGIDAPEKAQPFGQRSKQHLSELAFGKEAKADCYKVDR